MTQKIAILWKTGCSEGSISAVRGTVTSLSIAQGSGQIVGTGFALESAGECRIEATIAPDERPDTGRCLVTVSSDAATFSFFLADIEQRFPVFIPAYGVIVTTGADCRSFDEIETVITNRKTRTQIQQAAAEPEESFESAAAETREQRCPTWLGIGRDIRIFELSTEDEPWTISIKPRLHGQWVYLPECGNTPVRYDVLLGRGCGCRKRVRRHLDGGTLPILRMEVYDGDILYRATAYVGLENLPLSSRAIEGTHYLVADGHGCGNMMTESQKREFEKLLPRELNRDRETVLFLRVTVVNTGSVPRYAWLKTPTTGGQYSYDSATGFCRYEQSGRVFSIATLENTPAPQEEIALLLAPGEIRVWEVRIPHRPVPPDRATTIARMDGAEHLTACRAYWREKLDNAASFDIPEQRIAEMVRAGLLHLDLVAYGREPSGTIAPCIGVYCPIGSESSPIIQFFDSMGLHALAERALQYFLDKQHEDGFIQNFGGYMLETGAALFTIAEHFRYTRDTRWVKRIAPKLIKSCEYLIAWRRRNLREDLRNKGYGLIEGKVADPEDPFRSFMLNGYAWAGLAGVAEMIAAVHPAEARRFADQADAWRRDIRTALFEVLGRSPVVPLGDGTWCPSAGPWAEATGPLCLHATPGRWSTHGSAVSRDALIGPIHLIFQGVLDPGEEAADFLLNHAVELYSDWLVMFSQPYYSLHPWVLLQRGEVHAFLRQYYTCIAALADRETYTFWEHFYHVSPHKTHEEAWFLMQTRWMLYLEDGTTLKVCPGVPRRWLADGKTIAVEDAGSRFGRLSFDIQSSVDTGVIEARVACETAHRPAAVRIRLPHPDGQRGRAVEGGTYDPVTETVLIDPFPGVAQVKILF